jgi:hypothetical protein
MKNAEIFSVPSPDVNGYAWKWRCADSATESAQSFQLYFDCLTDAKRHGYKVELTSATGLTAPGGAQIGLV